MSTPEGKRKFGEPDYVSAKLLKAEHTYLLERGWKYLVKSKHYFNTKEVGYVFPGDRVFKDTAMAVQRSLDEYEGRM